jgi:hypothetical protein
MFSPDIHHRNFRDVSAFGRGNRIGVCHLYGKRPEVSQGVKILGK